MDNAFDTMTAGIAEAERTLRVADNLSGRMARLLIGRLRRVQDPHVLRALKRELRSYDAQQKAWRP